MRKLWFLKRNINLCSPETKLSAYKTIIRPMLEYACIVWDPHTKVSIDMLETVQKKSIAVCVQPFWFYVIRFRFVFKIGIESFSTPEKNRTAEVSL